MTVEDYLQRAVDCVRLAAGTTIEPMKKVLEDEAAFWRKRAADVSWRGGAHDRYVIRTINDVEEMSEIASGRWGQANDNRPG
jgi:hypothetical protein